MMLLDERNVAFLPLSPYPASTAPPRWASGAPVSRCGFTLLGSGPAVPIRRGSRSHKTRSLLPASWLKPPDLHPHSQPFHYISI